MSERRFACTLCGQCCRGWLPLTLDDALSHAGRFPLALIWTPVRQASRAFATTERIGATVRLPNRKTVAVRVVPTSYLPPDMPCPELGDDNRCRIHDDKPLRCRTMPFSPYRDEADQVDLLVPRPGWTCDTSDAAPVAYRDKAIVARADFDAERRALLRQAPLLRAHAEAALVSSPALMSSLAKAAGRPRDTGRMVTSFASLMPRLPRDTVAAFARAQHPVLVAFAERTADRPDQQTYHRHYAEWAADVARIRAAVDELAPSPS